MHRANRIVSNSLDELETILLAQYGDEPDADWQIKHAIADAKERAI